MRTTGVVLAALVALGAAGCAKPVDVEAERAAIRQTGDVEQLGAAQAKDLDRMLAFYTEDASMLPPNAPIATGHEAIRKVWEGITANRSVDWKTSSVEVASSGDMAWAWGTYELGVTDAKGKPATEVGKWLVVWKKQPDGAWKQVVGMYNADQPAPPEPMAAK